MSYRELPPPPALRGLVECLWTATPSGDVRVLPDGCMDLLLDGSGALTVAGPDTEAFVARSPAGARTAGLRFHPGALPRLLGVPAAELRNTRAALSEVAPGAARRLGEPEPVPAALFGAVAALAASAEPRRETAPWPLPVLATTTSRLAAGARVEELAADLGWSLRSLTRHCTAVYGYGPAVLRRVLRFRRAAALLHAGVPTAEVAARAGYADQPHLAREVRELAGVTASALSTR